MDPRLLQNIRRTVDRLSAGIAVLNREGKSLIPDGDTVYPVPEFPAAGECRILFQLRNWRIHFRQEGWDRCDRSKRES